MPFSSMILCFSKVVTSENGLCGAVQQVVRIRDDLFLGEGHLDVGPFLDHPHDAETDVAEEVVQLDLVPDLKTFSGVVQTILVDQNVQLIQETAGVAIAKEQGDRLVLLLDEVQDRKQQGLQRYASVEFLQMLIHDLLCFAQEVVFDAFQQGLSVRVVQVEGAAVEIRALRDVSG